MFFSYLTFYDFSSLFTIFIKSFLYSANNSCAFYMQSFSLFLLNLENWKEKNYFRTYGNKRNTDCGVVRKSHVVTLRPFQPFIRLFQSILSLLFSFFCRSVSFWCIFSHEILFVRRFFQHFCLNRVALHTKRDSKSLSSFKRAPTSSRSIWFFCFCRSLYSSFSIKLYEGGFVRCWKLPTLLMRRIGVIKMNRCRCFFVQYSSETVLFPNYLVLVSDSQYNALV